MSQHVIILPAAGEGWELWKGGVLARSVRDLSELSGESTGAVIGLPAEHVSTFEVKLPEVEEALIEPMAYSQVERRGLSSGSQETTVMDCQPLRGSPGEVLLSVDVLTGELPESWLLARTAGYTASARLIDCGEPSLCVYLEHGRLVVAVSRGGRVVYVQVLSSGNQIGAAAAQELNLLILSLQGDEVLDEAPDVLLLGEHDPGAAAEFERVCMASVSRQGERRLRHDLETVSPGLIPLPVAASRRKRSQRRRLLMAGSLTAVLYLAAAVWLFWVAESRANRITELRSQEADLSPRAEAVQRSAMRWQALEPAIEPSFYPLVQLSEVTRLMPPSGILISEFETRDRGVTIRGRARDAQIAFQFEEDLKGSPAFAAYQWDMPQPRVENNNSVRFDIKGKWSYAQPE